MSISAHSTTVVTEPTAGRSAGFLQWFLPFAIGVLLTIVVSLVVMSGVFTMSQGMALYFLGMGWISVTVTFPVIFLTSLILWAIPATRYRAGWLGPLLGWVLAPALVWLVNGDLTGEEFLSSFGLVYMTVIPVVFMIASYVLLRRRRRA